MMIPTLTRDQRRHLGRLIWKNIDGVAENVNRLMEAINHDPQSAVRVVATREWERAANLLQGLRDMVEALEASTSQVTIDQVIGQLRHLATIGEASPSSSGVSTPKG